MNREQREAIIRDGGLADLWELSPVRIEDNRRHTEEVINRLFPGNPLLCCGKSSSDFDTKPREEWRGELAQLQLIVPSPASKIEGLTKEGKPSRHCLDNTAPRRFLVIEQDQGTEDEQSAILLHLASRAPLALAVHSGGKSMHGWFYCHGQPEDRLEEFMRGAVELGADPRLWTRSQFCRMPDGTRDNGKRQTVFFLQPLRHQTVKSLAAEWFDPPTVPAEERPIVTPRPWLDITPTAEEIADSVLIGPGHWLTRGSGVMIVGPTGSGKSTLHATLAFSFAINRAALGFVPTRPIKNLVV